MQIQLYRDQCAEIVCVGEALGIAAQTSPAPELRSRLAQLAGLVQIHLAMKSRLLYPALKRCEDPSLRAIALRYERSTGTLASVFMEMFKHWSPPGAIEGERENFIRDFRTVWDALRERMRREEHELYDAIDLTKA